MTMTEVCNFITLRPGNPEVTFPLLEDQRKKFLM